MYATLRLVHGHQSTGGSQRRGSAVGLGVSEEGCTSRLEGVGGGVRQSTGGSRRRVVPAGWTVSEEGSPSRLEGVGGEVRQSAGLSEEGCGSRLEALGGEVHQLTGGSRTRGLSVDWRVSEERCTSRLEDSAEGDHVVFLPQRWGRGSGPINTCLCSFPISSSL